jgi:hypothetical protein
MLFMLFPLIWLMGLPLAAIEEEVVCTYHPVIYIFGELTNHTMRVES